MTLVDIDLGEDSGFEVARRLADDPELDPGHLILISAHAEEDLADLIEASPAIGFVGKPVLCATAIQRLLRAAGGVTTDPVSRFCTDAVGATGSSRRGQRTSTSLPPGGPCR